MRFSIRSLLILTAFVALAVLSFPVISTIVTDMRNQLGWQTSTTVPPFLSTIPYYTNNHRTRLRASTENLLLMPFPEISISLELIAEPVGFFADDTEMHAQNRTPNFLLGLGWTLFLAYILTLQFHVKPRPN